MLYNISKLFEGENFFAALLLAIVTVLVLLLHEHPYVYLHMPAGFATK